MYAGSKVHGQYLGAVLGPGALEEVALEAVLVPGHDLHAAVGRRKGSQIPDPQGVILPGAIVVSMHSMCTSPHSVLPSAMQERSLHGEQQLQCPAALCLGLAWGMAAASRGKKRTCGMTDGSGASFLWLCGTCVT